VNAWQPGVPAGMKRCAGAPAPARTYAAIGDSYASGIGTDAAEDDGCRRSPTSYFGLLRGSLKQGITTSDDRFQACSGDTSHDIRENQMDALDRTTRVVTLSAGGNDFDFPKVVEACVKYDALDNKGCDDAVDEHVSDGDVARVRRDLGRLYAAVRRAAPNAQVYVLGYPELIDPDDVDGCYSLGDDDGELLHDTATTFNRTIRRAIGKRRGFRFVGLAEAFRDHPACKDGGTPWINGVVSLEAPERDESFHPNDAGHQGIAARLRAVAPQYFR
jgi:lysophospholipase L1-like esterase